METTTLTCPSCKSTCFEPDVKCEVCGFPLKGTEREKAVFIGQKYVKKQKEADGSKTVRVNQTILFIVGGLNIVIGLFSYATNKFGSIQLIVSLILGFVFIGMGILAKFQPLIAFTIALLLLLSLYFLSYLGDPDTLARGILWKIIIIGCLIYGIARSIEKK